MQLGVDFGTSNTRVALRDEGDPIALPLGGSDPFVPSVIALRKSSSGQPEIFAVSERAGGLADSAEILVIENLKRCLMYAIRPWDAAYLPSWWDKETQTVRAFDQTVDPKELVGAMLESALRNTTRAASIYGIDLSLDSAKDALTTVGCPAYSGFAVHEILATIMQSIGVPKFGIGDIVEEPNLAAMALAGRRELYQPQDQKRPFILMIYDLGGGTFDTAIVEIRLTNGLPELTVLGADCLPFLGGMDLDAALLRRLTPSVAKALGVDEEEINALLDWEQRRLLRAVRETKMQLSESDEETLAIGDIDGKSLQIPVRREDVECALRDARIVEETTECSLRAYRRARMYLNRDDIGGFHMGTDSQGRVGKSVTQLNYDDLKTDVDAVLLVGGSTKIPALRKQLAEKFGAEKILPDRPEIDPLTANSLGAAMDRTYLPAVLTRASYYVSIKAGSSEQVAYWPFDPYLWYEFTSGIGGERAAACNLTLEGEKAAIIFRDCRGEDASEYVFETLGHDDCCVAFDRYGRVHVCAPGRPDGEKVHGCDDILWPPDDASGVSAGGPWPTGGPPWQHQYQRQMFEAKEAEEERQRLEAKRRLDEQLRRNPALEND
jgi:molecular chaperone DnaK (HSP70)